MANPIKDDSNDKGSAEDASDDDEELDSYRINEALYGMIKDSLKKFYNTSRCGGEPPPCAALNYPDARYHGGSGLPRQI
jgi:hypothetical protein